jgi:excisionase family DNA binding protein
MYYDTYIGETNSLKGITMSINKNGVMYLDYKEAARELGVEEATINTLVTRGKLSSIKFPGNRRKYISKPALDYYRKGKEAGGSLIMQPARDGLPHFPGETPVSIQDVLHLINEGYAHISNANKEASEQIAERYQQTVSPVLQFVINPQERALIDAMSLFMQQLLNNAIVMIKNPASASTTPEDVLNMLLNGIDLPPVLRAIMRDAFDKIAKIDAPVSAMEQHHQ